MNRLERDFPNLSATPYQFTSPAEPRYNCIAWAAGDDTRWWEPDAMGICFWPYSVSRNYTMEAYVSAFEAMGYSECTDADFEKGVVKVAIYADNRGKPQHAARQLENGRWTSKCGPSEDIEHTLDAFDGSGYGSPVVFLKRAE